MNGARHMPWDMNASLRPYQWDHTDTSRRNHGDHGITDPVECKSSYPETGRRDHVARHVVAHARARHDDMRRGGQQRNSLRHEPAVLRAWADVRDLVEFLRWVSDAVAAALATASCFSS